MTSALPPHPDTVTEPNPEFNEAMQAITQRWGMAEVALVLGEVARRRAEACQLAETRSEELNRPVRPEPFEAIAIGTYRNELLAALGINDPRFRAVHAIASKLFKQSRALLAITEWATDLPPDELTGIE